MQTPYDLFILDRNDRQRAERLKQGLNVVPFLTTQLAKANIILALKSAPEHARVKLLNDEVQKKVLLAFEEKVANKGSFSYSTPAGLHDDCVMASAIAWNV